MCLIHVLPKILFSFFHRNFGILCPNFKNTGQKMKFSIKDLKNFRKCFFFHQKYSFCCQDIHFFKSFSFLSSVLRFRIEFGNGKSWRHKMPCLKSDYHLPKKICFICFNERPLKMMKNAFDFIVKTFFVL